MSSAPSPIRAVQIVSPPAGGGAVGVTGPERRTANIVGKWAGHGVAPIVCYPRRGVLRPVFEAAGVPLVDFEIGTKFNLGAIGAIADVARAHGADLVHTQGPPSLDLLAVLAARRCAIASVVTRPVMIELESAYSPSRRRLYTAIDRRLTLRLADRVVAVSDEGARHLRDVLGVSSQRLRRIHNGIDVSSFAAKAVGAHDGSPSQPVVIGMIGHLLPYKGWPDFVEAIARLRGEGLDVRGLAIGEGSDRAMLEALVQGRGDLARHFVFAGYQSDVRSALQQIDIYLMTTLREGLSVAIIEAMAAGLPLVTTDVGGVREQIVEGETGFILAVHDVDGMVAACARLVRDPSLRATMGARSRASAQERFSETRMIAEYADCYREAVAIHRVAAGAAA